MLDDTTLDALCQRLQARARELGADIRSVDIERAAPEAGTPQDDVEDMGDQGERLARQAVRDAEEARDVGELRQVAAALERMDAGSYGDCIDCGTDIDERRLQVQPFAARCLDCQERHERLHPLSVRSASLAD